MNYSPGRSRDTIERRRATPPGPATPSGRSRRARGRPCEIPGSGKGLTSHRRGDSTSTPPTSHMRDGAHGRNAKNGAPSREDMMPSRRPTRSPQDHSGSAFCCVLVTRPRIPDAGTRYARARVHTGACALCCALDPVRDTQPGYSASHLFAHPDHKLYIRHVRATAHDAHHRTPVVAGSWHSRAVAAPSCGGRTTHPLTLPGPTPEPSAGVPVVLRSAPTWRRGSRCARC